MASGLLDVDVTGDRWLLAEGALYLLTGLLLVVVYGQRILAYWSYELATPDLTWLGPLPWFVVGLGALIAGTGLVLGVALGRHLLRVMTPFLAAYLVFLAFGWEPWSLVTGLLALAALATLVGAGLLQFTKRGREHLKHAGAWPAPGA